MDCTVSAIHNARKRIRITTPYLIPPKQVSAALEVAASSGIDVELILPAQGDSWIAHHASMSYLKPLLRNHVKVYLYEKGFIHAKTITVDGKLSMVGTVNMDVRSYLVNFEVAALVYDESLTKKLDDAFEEDIEDCRKLEYERWQQRGVWKRGIDSCCRLMTPLL